MFKDSATKRRYYHLPPVRLRLWRDHCFFRYRYLTLSLPLSQIGTNMLIPSRTTVPIWHKHFQPLLYWCAIWNNPTAKVSKSIIAPQLSTPFWLVAGWHERILWCFIFESVGYALFIFTARLSWWVLWMQVDKHMCIMEDEELLHELLADSDSEMSVRN